MRDLFSTFMATLDRVQKHRIAIAKKDATIIRLRGEVEVLHMRLHAEQERRVRCHQKHERGKAELRRQHLAARKMKKIQADLTARLYEKHEREVPYSEFAADAEEYAEEAARLANVRRKERRHDGRNG